MSDSPYSTVLENMYPEAHVHHGFLEQLQAVTDKAPNRTQNIGDVVMDMSGGVPPSLVIVTGESARTAREVTALWACIRTLQDSGFVQLLLESRSSCVIQYRQDLHATSIFESNRTGQCMLFVLVGKFRKRFLRFMSTGQAQNRMH